jgi:molecular chaperone GrpE
MASDVDKTHPGTGEPVDAAEQAENAVVAEDLYPDPDEGAGDQSGSDPDKAAQEIAALKDQALRAQAEMENIKRRAKRDVEHAHKYALERFTNDLLPVVDSLEKALESEGTEDAAAVIEGVALAHKLFVTTLEKSSVTQIDPLGEPFNPEFHEAMAMVENPDAEPNSVMDVMQKGYTLNGRLIRAAKVIVVKDTKS